MTKTQPNRPYIHFKGNLYYVHNIVEHTETGELLVVYQCLYPPFGMYTRSLSMFEEDVDVDREDNVTGQSKRFMLFDGKMNIKKK